MMKWQELMKLSCDINYLRHDMVQRPDSDLKRMIELDMAHKSVLEYKIDYLLRLLDKHNINPYQIEYMDCLTKKLRRSK